MFTILISFSLYPASRRAYEDRDRHDFSGFKDGLRTIAVGEFRGPRMDKMAQEKSEMSRLDVTIF
jgi:hypothetical protein